MQLLPAIRGIRGLGVALPIVANHQGHEEESPPDPPSPRGRGRSRMAARIRRLPRWVWWMVGLFAGVLVYFNRSGQQGGGLGPGFWAFLALLCGVIGLLIVLSLLILVRPRHRRISSALRLARSGHVDDAIADIQRQVETGGPSAQRSGALGDCYLLLEEWSKAYIHYLDAERMDGRRGRYLAKQGFALWKMDRAAEAATLLATARRMEPMNPSHAWTSCLILADLGRYDEAREQLRTAETLMEQGLPLDATRREALENSLEVCRKRLAQVPGSEGEHPAGPT